MEDFFDAAAIAEISAQLEAELAGHNFELVFDYTPYDGVQAPEGYQEPEFHFPEFQLPNETPARFYFDEEGRPCSGDDEDRQCEIIATMKPSKDAVSKPAETEVVKEMERPMSPMPMLIQEDPQTNADLEDYTPSGSVPPLEAMKPTSSADVVKIEPAPTPEACDSVPKSTEKPVNRTRIVQGIHVLADRSPSSAVFLLEKPAECPPSWHVTDF
uniref:TMV resistance protein N-like n=1 Tax=Panagrellus redivivus TaxID=6233 RepID=A0A7E4VF61_PANRE